MHLVQRADHAEKCTTRGCVAGCGYREFHAWLDAPMPLTAGDARRQKRAAERAAELAAW